MVTDDTTPTIADLEALPFAVVEPAVTPAAAAPADLSPELGEDDVKIHPSFSWTAVGDADSYEWMIAEDMGRLDPFEIPDDARTTDVSAIVITEDLKYSTTYLWRVRAVDDEGNKGDWVTGLFTTAAAPVPEPEPPEPLPPVEIIQTPAAGPPQITLTIPAAPSPVQAIPSYLLWVVVAVGAVLVIAVIVLIVRTRRVA